METTLFSEIVEKNFQGWTPKKILDAGANDASQSVELVRRFPGSRAWAFEANPSSHEAGVRNARNTPAITYIPMAVAEHDGKIEFNDVPTNGGAGSLFKPSGLYDPIEKMPFNTITVPCVRLDSYIEKNNVGWFDVMWLDAQGGELAIIKSLGKYLDKVKAIWTEFEHIPMYSGQPLLPELQAFLEGSGFKFVYRQECVSGVFGEGCFLRL